MVCVYAGPTGGEAQPQAPVQNASVGHSQQQARANASQEPSETAPQPVAENLPPHSSTTQAAPPDTSKQPEISFRQALAEQEASKSEGVSSSPVALRLAASEDAGRSAPAEGSSATTPSGSSEGSSSHANSVASPGDSLPPQGDAAAASSTSGRQASIGRRLRRRAWPVVNRRRGQESNGILVDKYSTVVSDSDTSEEEDMHQSAPLLGGINAGSIQSGDWMLLWVVMSMQLCLAGLQTYCENELYTLKRDQTCNHNMYCCGNLELGWLKILCCVSNCASQEGFCLSKVVT